MGALGSAELSGEFGRSPIGRRYRVCDDGTQARSIEYRERRRGGSSLGAHLLAQCSKGFDRMARHLCGPKRRLQSELVRNLVGQPTLVGGGLERFHEQEEVGRSAARERGDGIHL